MNNSVFLYRDWNWLYCQCLGYINIIQSSTSMIPARFTIQDVLNLFEVFLIWQAAGVFIRSLTVPFGKRVALCCKFKKKIITITLFSAVKNNEISCFFVSDFHLNATYCRERQIKAPTLWLCCVYHILIINHKNHL